MPVEALLGEVPAGWEKTTLGDACRRGGGDIQTGPFGSQLHASDYVTDGIPSIMPQNIGDNRVIEDGIARITMEDARRLARYRVRRGDIVYSRRGDVERRALIREKEDGWLCGTGCLRVRFGDADVDSGYASYYLGHPAVRDWIVRHAHGATMANLNTSILSSLPFVLPTPHEQHAIAHILGTLDDKIDLNHRMNKTLEAIARGIFESWFVDFKPVHAKASGESLESICRRLGLTPELLALFPDRFQNSELGEIPEGWKVTSLSDLFRDDDECVITGPFGSTLHAHDYREEGVPLILVKHVVDGDILDDDLPLVGDHKLAELRRYRLQLGDIVFTRVGAVGRSAYVHERSVGWLISGQMLRVRIADWSVLHPRYLAQLFLEKAFTEMVEVHALGTTRPSLNTGLLRHFRFIAPGGDLLRVFADTVAPFDELVQKNRQVSHNLVAVRDALLPKLLSGEMPVPIGVT